MMRVPLWLCVCVLTLDSSASHTLFTCEPVRVQWCVHMPYNTTFFPNMLEHYDQDIAALKMKLFMPLASLRCSPDVHLFLCQAFVPECRDHTRVLRPCRERCERVQSDCSRDMLTFGISWPSELRCDRLESCRFSPDGSAVSAVEELTTSRSSPSSGRDLGFWCPLHLKTRTGQAGSFLGAQDCAPPCDNMFLKPHEVQLAKTFIGVCSAVCLCATLFTSLTFLIDVQRFRYPERPIIFYSVCYTCVSLVYFIGFLLDTEAACVEPSVPGRAATVVLGAQSRGCTLLFMLLYFCSTAGMVWWVILTITWFLAAGPKWSCEAIEKKAVWFHAVAWGLPGALTVSLLALGKVEGDGVSGVCFVGLYDLAALRWFVVAPLALGVLVGLSLLLAGIVSLNHVRQVIQHDERNQEKLKKFMIRIGVFSGLYLLPLLALLGCYLYEQAQRESWENSWIRRHCQEFSIPCSRRSVDVERPELSLFLIKYLMTLVVGISAVFWVSSKKTCWEWASFFKRTRKKDPISESRRVLQESCEFFLKHNSRVQQHKSKHYKSSSHKLKVVSKSTGTSTGMHTPVTGNHDNTPVTGNHDNTPVSTAIHNHSVCDAPGSSERIGSMERRSRADAESAHRLTPKDEVEAGQSSAHCSNSQ
ncbi:frizzled-6 isoform X1 [Rhinichthys klamathensis goyatoka]|uniref:frizzled-6 isoform X1 n=2 Tax=Rhinichthys klamathensis goyatoka TaxID=3034132 RepID=UPI0024B4C54F|nr:frizzled-6 isoform X1 [Rhinichthys klamathensis goyatoka]